MAAASLLLFALLGACSGGFAAAERAEGPAVDASLPRQADVIVAPTTLGVVDSARVDVNGTPIGVACATCHHPDGTLLGDAGPPERFHTGVELRHGDLSCAHCHDPVDRSKLRLANGESVALLDAMTLCAQCHGPQARDFRHGAHGGMNGYWDTRRAPRERTVCVTCHAPHSPAYEKVTPVHAPQDRFLTGEGEN